MKKASKPSSSASRAARNTRSVGSASSGNAKTCRPKLMLFCRAATHGCMLKTPPDSSELLRDTLAFTRIRSIAGHVFAKRRRPATVRLGKLIFAVIGSDREPFAIVAEGGDPPFRFGRMSGKLFVDLDTVRQPLAGVVEKTGLPGDSAVDMRCFVDEYGGQNVHIGDADHRPIDDDRA